MRTSVILLVLAALVAGGGYFYHYGWVQGHFALPIGWPTPNAGMRIVSLAPSVTEIVCELGARDNLVGVTDVCDYPDPVKRLPVVGSMVSPSIEKVLSLKPDAVFCSRNSGNRVETAEVMRNRGLAVLAIEDNTLDNLKLGIVHFGKVLKREMEARKIVADFDDAIKRCRALQARLKGKRALWILTREPFYTCGRGTLHHELLREFNLLNSFPFEGFKEYSVEALMAAQPDYIFDISGNYEGWWESMYAEVAIKSKIILLDSAVYSRPGPRLPEGLRALARILASK